MQAQGVDLSEHDMLPIGPTYMVKYQLATHLYCLWPCLSVVVKGTLFECSSELCRAESHAGNY